MVEHRTADPDRPSDRTTVLMRLIQLIKQGNQQAVNELIALASNRIRKVAAKILRSDFGAATPDLYRTEDVAQEALLRLIERLREAPVNDVDHLFSLTGRIVRCYLLDLAKRRSMVNVDSEDQARLAVADAAGTTSLEAGNPQTVSLLEAIETLSPKQRELADKIVVLGLTQEEIAEQMGVQKETVKKQWQRARIQLAQALRPSEGA